MEITKRMSTRWVVSIGRVLSCIFVLTTALGIYACSSPTGFGGPLDSTWSQWLTPEDAGFSQTALETLPEYLSTLNTTGLMVVVDGKVLLHFGDLEELSYVASVRKSILAMLYGPYVVDGTIDLDRTLEELGMDDHGGLMEIERRATVRHLLTARSGVYHDASNSGDDSDSAPARGSQEPGSYFLYNNWDFNAAGAAFELMTGGEIFDALMTDLAEPLGFEDFQRSRQEKRGNLDRSIYPAYHMWLSTRDMARVGQLMLQEGNWDGHRLIPESWVREVTSLVTHREQMNPESRRSGAFGYGYMWWIWDSPSVSPFYSGAYTAKGAYGQYITVLPALAMVVAHKPAVGDGRGYNSTSWSGYQGVLNRLLAAKCQASCN